MYTIAKIQYGAHLYGTATPDSDIDIKGVFLPSKEQVFLGKIPKSQNYSTRIDGSKNTRHDIDCEMYSFHYFIKLACKGQTVAMDMLHAPHDMVLESSDIWDKIVANRDRFYSKNLTSFIDYARSQANKYCVKGSRIKAIQQVLNILKADNPNNKLLTIWDNLPRIEHCYDVEMTPNGFRQYQICGKTFQETAKLGYIIPILESFYEEYGRRTKLAAENKNVDWKAVSHALRTAYQTKEIITKNKIVFPLKNAEFLKHVKQGKLDYLTEVAPMLDAIMVEVEELLKNCELPERVDFNFWDEFICQTLEEKFICV